MSSRVIQCKNIYDAGFHEFYTYGTGALASNIGIFNSVQAMTIKNGNVGIGTAIPTEKLHIEGNIFAKGNVTCSNISVIGDFVTLNTITSNTEQMVIENAGTGPALKVTQTGNNSVAEFYDKESGISLFLGNGGNIGIGTNNPLGKLQVNGIIKNENPSFCVVKTDNVYGPVQIPYNVAANIINNTGGCFNSTTGKFTAPITGRYFMSFTGMTIGTYNPFYQFRINGSIPTPVNNYSTYSQTVQYSRGSMSFIFSLNAGDTVDVYLGDATTSLHAGYNQFTGYLIS